MIHGAVGIQSLLDTPEAAAATLRAYANFRTGVYEVGGVPVTAADVVEHPEYIDANGLQLGEVGADETVDVLGAFLAVMGSGDWTVIVEIELQFISAGEQSIFWLDDGAFGEFVYLFITSGNVPAAIHENVTDSQEASVLGTVAVGVHKIALTRSNEKLVISANGGDIDIAPGVTIGSLTRMSLGGIPDDIADILRIRSIAVYDARPNEELPGLSAL